MGERHAYGTACFCFSRRLFLLALFAILAAMNILIVGDWFASKHAVQNFLTFSPQKVHGCSGFDCYQVFSCSGLRETTQHLREPVASLTGAVFFPLGVFGAQDVRAEPLKLVSLYLLGLVVLQGVIILADFSFIRVCDEFPKNVVFQTLLWGPVAPMPPAAQQALRAMDAYPQSEVARITGGLKVESWYLLVAGLYWALLAYALAQVRWLLLLAERGPLGLGMHYGLDQWDEAINYDALAVKRMRETHVGRSKLSEDEDDTNVLGDVEAPFGYHVLDSGYGATAAARAGGGGYGATSFGGVIGACDEARLEAKARLREVLESAHHLDDDVSDLYGGESVAEDEED